LYLKNVLVASANPTCNLVYGLTAAEYKLSISFSKVVLLFLAMPN